MKKIKHVWSVLCKSSVIDQTDNNISIHGVLEELSVTLNPIEETGKLPEKFVVPMTYEIISLWLRSNKAESVGADLEYTLLDSDNKELLKNTQRIEIPTTSRRFRSRMIITGLPLTKQGDYYFQIKIKEEGLSEFNLAAELPLEVKITSEKATLQ